MRLGSGLGPDRSINGAVVETDESIKGGLISPKLVLEVLVDTWCPVYFLLAGRQVMGLLARLRRAL